jgi:hypothetical protein
MTTREKQKRIQSSIYIEDEVFEYILEAARSEDRSTNSMIRILVKEALRDRGYFTEEE